MTDIHKGGRPQKYDDTFYISIVQQYETNTIGQIAEHHNVTRTTISRWLKRGRDLLEKESA